MSDPNGWVQNPPNKFVTVVNLTSQPSLNGLYALVLGFGNGRYVVVMTESSRQVSLKAENLVGCTWKEQMVAQYQLFTNSPQVRLQLEQVWNRVRQTAPFVKTPQQLLVGIAGIFLCSIYFLGFSRTLLLTSFAMMLGMVFGPIWTTNLRELWPRIPPRLRFLVRQSELPFSKKIASNNYLLATMVLLILFVFVTGMMPRTSKTTAPMMAGTTSSSPPSWMSRFLGSSSSTATSTSSSSPLLFTEEQRQQYYKLGFDDATKQRSYGHSLELPDAQERILVDETTLNLDSLEEEFSSTRTSTLGGLLPRSRQRKSSFWNIGQFVTFAYSGNSLYQLGRTVDGQWNWDLFRQNLAMQAPWKLALLGLTVYRLVSSALSSSS